MSKSVKNLALILGALVVAALLATSACTEQPTTTATPTNIPPVTPTPTVQPGEDDDRPPIIVSGGSVHLRAVAKNGGVGTNNDPGEWKYNKGKKLWTLDHSSLMPGKHLLVRVLNGKDSPSCANYTTEYDVRELTLNYGSSGSLRIFIDSPNASAAGDLSTDAPATRDAGIPFWLDVGALGDRPTSVVLVKDVNSAGKDVKCGLDPNRAEVHIYQRIN